VFLCKIPIEFGLILTDKSKPMGKFFELNKKKTTPNSGRWRSELFPVLPASNDPYGLIGVFSSKALGNYGYLLIRSKPFNRFSNENAQISCIWLYLYVSLHCTALSKHSAFVFRSPLLPSYTWRLL